MSKSDKLLILDLDETLIFATERSLNLHEDFKFGSYFVYKRPYLDEFLNEVSSKFTLGVWSSASDDYVSGIAKLIVPAHINLFITWGRSKCTLRRNSVYDTLYFEKRLGKIKNKGFGLEKILLVDDTPEKARSNYGNAVYLKEFKGDKSDNELPDLCKYLISIMDVENVRVIEKRNWKTQI
ncbi:MAG: HAD family hydrolase [Chitinophagaceae bacterium]|nr:HAD family hydrolase [Chitinophagaceae bacterium]